MKTIKKVILFGAAFSLASCATMMSGTSQSIKVDSVPSGAKVFIATKDQKTGAIGTRTEAGVTPITVSISRKDGVVILEKEGYQATEVVMQRTLNPWVWGDVVLTSLLSTSIDTSTGASNEYDPGEYTVELQPEVVEATAVEE
ncbi:hypothetical protein R50072_25360 [Simiduia litorea]|uniref:hypothetical protein n=1 Tax=Simiduia litorea TaxID=1435348 RepID=UPI0036F3E42D